MNGPGRAGGSARADAAPGTRRPLIAVTGRPLRAGRVTGWARDGAGIQGAYLDAVRRADALPVILDPIDLDARGAHALLSRFDGLVLTGGPDVDPATYRETAHESVYGIDSLADAFEIPLCRAAVLTDFPTLAICRGIQVLNVALGGTLHQHLPDVEGLDTHGAPGVPGGEMVHDVHVEPGALLAQVLGTERPTCSCHHHQAIAVPGRGVRVTARAADGVVEGMEVEGTSILAVQWHPEDTAATDPTNQRLFDALAAHARRSLT